MAPLHQAGHPRVSTGSLRRLKTVAARLAPSAIRNGCKHQHQRRGARVVLYGTRGRPPLPERGHTRTHPLTARPAALGPHAITTPHHPQTGPLPHSAHTRAGGAPRDGSAHAWPRVQPPPPPTSSGRQSITSNVRSNRAGRIGESCRGWIFLASRDRTSNPRRRATQGDNQLSRKYPDRGLHVRVGVPHEARERVGVWVTWPGPDTTLPRSDVD